MTFNGNECKIRRLCDGLCFVLVTAPLYFPKKFCRNSKCKLKYILFIAEKFIFRWNEDGFIQISNVSHFEFLWKI